MVRRGQSYGTSAQRQGKSAGQRLARNVQNRTESLRNANKTDIVVGSKPIRLEVGGRSNVDLDDYGMYAVVRENGEWALRALCVSEKQETVTYRNGWPDGASSKVTSRHLMSVGGRLSVEDGLLLGRFETKTAALNKVNAEASERLKAGSYVVRPTHVTENSCGNPRVYRSTIDSDALKSFQQKSMRVYD